MVAVQTHIQCYLYEILAVHSPTYGAWLLLVPAALKRTAQPIVPAAR